MFSAFIANYYDKFNNVLYFGASFDAISSLFVSIIPVQVILLSKHGVLESVVCIKIVGSLSGKFFYNTNTSILLFCAIYIVNYLSVTKVIILHVNPKLRPDSGRKPFHVKG